MKLNEALLKRINEICKKEKGMTACAATLGGGKSPSAIYDLAKGRTKSPKVETIQRFCEGAGLTMSEFLDSEYFVNIDD